jgi:tetratricopeptide (TPR) repeat protein
MNSHFETVLRKVEVQRKSGDAYRKNGNKECASEAFEEGERLLDKALSLPDQENVDPKLLAEAHGARGGILRRLGKRREALQAYKDGALIEKVHGLNSTYNRLNFLKYQLLTGDEKLRALEPELKSLAEFIENSLTNTSKVAESNVRDSGWAWADLADCHALLGDLDKAEKFYITFIEKSETKSPKTALDVLNEVAKHLEESGDPDCERVRAAATSLASRLGISTS